MAAQQGYVKQGGVPVPPVQEALGRLGGEGDGLVGGADKDAGHGKRLLSGKFDQVLFYTFPI